MNRKKTIILFTVIAAFFVACKPNFSVNDKKQDISIAYCLLNMNETNHYVKIYKAFLTDENAYIYAANSGLEAISYMDSIEVKMEEYLNGVLTRTIPFDTTTTIPKDSGVFHYPTQILYAAKNVKLNPDATYLLKLKNKYTNKETYAETNMINNFFISLPNSEVDLTYSKTVNCGFTLTANAAMYEMYQILRYIEVDKRTGEETKHSVRRRVSSGEVNPSAPTVIKYDVNKIYKVIADHLKKNENVIRKIDTYACLDYEAWIAGRAFSLYMKAYNQSSSVLNNKIDYTNFVSENNNAFGVFSSRNSAKRTYTITSASEDSLVNGQYTKHLGFVKATR